MIATPQPLNSNSKSELDTIVTVEGTGEHGLRVRNDPGLDSFYITVAKEGDQLRVVEGPVDLDEIIWWKVQSLSDKNINGWCAADYLAWE